MKFNDISPNVITEQLNENNLPAKFAQIAIRDFGFSKEELGKALKSLSFKAFMNLINAFDFQDYQDARDILMRSVGGGNKMGLVPQEEDRDYDRADAEMDDFSDRFVNWVNDNIIGSKYLTVYDILEAADVDEDPWMAIEDTFPEGSSEDWVVDRNEAKDFLSYVVKNPAEAIQKYAKPISALYDDDDLKDEFKDGEDYDRMGPERYYGVSR